MTTLILIELRKIFSKWRSFVGFIAIAALVPVVQVAMASEGEGYFRLFTQTLRNTFEFSGNLTNGYLIGFVVLNAMIVHIPLLVALVAGDLLAGEATAGTFRLLLTRPPSRMMYVSAKFIAGVIYANLLVAWLALLSLGTSTLFLGSGELIVVSSVITILPADDVLWRFFYAYGFAALSMTTVAALAFCFGAFVENAIGPIAATMAVIIVFTIVSTLDAPFIQAVKPFLFTNHSLGWRLMFDDPVDWPRVASSAGILAAHIAALFTAAAVAFTRKDVLS